MKKLLSFLFLLIFISLLASSKVHATDITVGATTWFSWINQSYTKNIPGTSNTERSDPLPLIGPALSVKFNEDFNLTFIFLYGNNNVASEFVPPVEYCDYRFHRYDADLALNYRLNDYFKVFAGIKFMDFRIKNMKTYPVATAIKDIDHLSCGPGLGLSAAFPLLKDLFLLANLSGFGLLGNES